jgi:hypothetical protein
VLSTFKSLAHEATGPEPNPMLLPQEQSFNLHESSTKEILFSRVANVTRLVLYPYGIATSDLTC